MRPAEILVKMLLNEANPLDWARQQVSNFKQARQGYQAKQRQQQRQRQQQQPVTMPVTRPGQITHIAVVYGPNLPETGYYATGVSEKALLDKLKSAMKQKLGVKAVNSADYNASVNSWIVNGYQTLEMPGSQLRVSTSK